MMDKVQSLLVTSDSKENSLLDLSGLGPRRSIVRRIGTQLPLGCAARPTFELLPNGSHVIRAYGKKTSMFSLADVIQLDEPLPESIVPIRASASVPNLNDTAVSEIPITSSVSATSVTSASQEHMVTKISALEDELAFLRTQIAALVTTQQHQANVSSFNVSISSNLEAPTCTSTPLKAPPAPPGIPPPPPPPPPPPQLTSGNERKSVQELIRERKHGKSSSPTAKSFERLKSSVPDMADVLKDLHKVKLKSVSRSPGGTPFNKKKDDLEVVAGDPASLIAAALKKKFAHRKNFDSPKSDEVDDSFETNNLTPVKGFPSPNQTPKFGQHLLKRRNTSPAPTTTPKPELPTFLKKRRDLENVNPQS
uniref:mitochondrial fission regulator 2-like n=1 Tax=Styela clava TaxID=7725 RepID=UPI00193AD028|nr:mitochondrial fission regulator 2-like [Styela clava]